MAFSVYTNGAKLLSTEQTAGSLTCVHGVRFLSMTWVVLGHCFIMPAGAACEHCLLLILLCVCVCVFVCVCVRACVYACVSVTDACLSACDSKIRISQYLEKNVENNTIALANKMGAPLEDSRTCVS